MKSSHSDLKKALIEKAKTVFETNTYTGYSSWKKTDYSYIAPANKEYTYQWLWDTGFHAIVLSHFDPERAKNEIRTFMLGQWDDGFLPHVIFWGNRKVLPFWAYSESKPSLRPRTTAITQPPILGFAIEAIYEKDKDVAFLREIVPKLALHYKWLLQNRDHRNEHLLSIISPNESGMDELPVFQHAVGFLEEDPVRLHYAYRNVDMTNYRLNYDNDKIFRNKHFNVKEVLFNCAYVGACRSMMRLFRVLGDEDEAMFFQNTAELCEKAILEKCWDDKDELFYSLYSDEEKQAKINTISSLIPLFLGGLRSDKLTPLVERHLLNPDEFWTQFPVPTVAKNERYYYPADPPAHMGKLLWRGPTWIATNWFIVKGLRKHGYTEIAQQIVDKMVEMITKHGFREYYNPETGQGYRRKNFGWSTLIIDLL